MFVPSKVIYNKNGICVKETGREYDFIATIENTTNDTIIIFPDKSNDDSAIFEEFEINPCDWVGILADEEGRNTLRAIKQEKISTNHIPNYV